MSEPRKKLLSSVFQSILLLLIGGIALFILLLLGSFGAFPAETIPQDCQFIKCFRSDVTCLAAYKQWNYPRTGGPV